MPTRTYTRGTLARVNAEELAERLRANRGWAQRPSVECDPTIVLCTHALIVPADDMAIQEAINSYVDDPDFELPAEERALRGIYTVLKGWAAEEAATVSGWSSLTATQKDSAHRQLHQRFGVLVDRLADLIRHLGVTGA